MNSFDYEAKYLGKSQEITPNNFSEMTEVSEALIITKNERLLENGVYHCRRRALHARDEHCPRSDIKSLLPQQSLAAGISLEDLFTML
jgi:D-alanine-D-alanine ligase